MSLESFARKKIDSKYAREHNQPALQEETITMQFYVYLNNGQTFCDINEIYYTHNV